MWIVHANPPKNFLNSKWDFRHNYFPRKFAYKKDAIEAAQEAKNKGGTEVRIEKAK